MIISRLPLIRPILAALFLIAAAAAPAAAAACTWVGTGVDNRFSTASNWDTNPVLPQTNDDIIFPAGVWSLTNTPVNDMTGLVVNAINIYEKYSITGNAVFCQIINVNNAGITNIALPLATVGSAVLTVTVLDATATLNLSGLISGAGPTTWSGPGRKRLNGTVNNTLSGLNSVAGGVLELDSTASEAIAGPLTILVTGIVVLTNAPDIKDSVVVTTAGTFNLSAATGSDGANTETIGGLAGSGTGVVNLGANTLGCVGQSAPTNYAGIFQGTGSFRQSGSGIQVLSGTMPTYAGTVLLAGGEIHVWDNQTTSPINVTSGTLVLADDCFVGAVTLSGGSASTLAFSTLSAMALHGTATPTVTVGSGSRFRVDVNPTTNGYGALPAVTITGATLVVDTSLFTPTLTSVMTIVDNSGASPITGTFSGLAQGATVVSSTNSGTTFTISYIGGTGNDITLTAVTAASDSTAPVISAVASGSLTPGSATITWTTNEAADSQVDYGLTTAYGDSTSLADTSPRVTSHSVLLSRLSPATLYHYRVRSADAAGNLRISADATFTTAATVASAPVISAVAATASVSAASITWTTSEVADSQVEYGTDIGYGSLTTLDASMVTSHRVAIAGLSPSTTYHYRVFSTDADGNVAVSADGTFSTRRRGSSDSSSCGLGGLFSSGLALGLLLIARRKS